MIVKRNRHCIFHLVVFGLLLSLTFACEKDDPAELATLGEFLVSDITASSAVLSGKIENNGGVRITDMGVVWNTAGNPSLESHEGKNSSGSNGESFSITLTELSAGTNYYVRGYATNSVGTTYSDQIMFTTQDEPAVITSLEIVAGDGQAAVAGTTLSDPLIVRVLDEQGAPVTGAEVVFSVLEGDGSADPDRVTSGEDGRAQTVWTLGDLEGENIVEARVEDIEPVTFTAHAVIPRLCGTITSDRLLRALDVPYVLCSAGASVTSGALLEMEPGVTIIAESGALLRIRSDGSLRAAGTEDDPIRFLADDESPGSWHGIWLESPSDDNELTWVEIAYGGGSQYANLYASGQGRVRVTNCIFRNSSRQGMNIGASGVTLPEFSANEFRDNTLSAVRIYPTQMSFMDEASTFTGNGEDVIEVRPGGITGGTHTWRKTTKPFLITNYISLSSDITVEAGAEFLLQKGASGIRVYSDGALRAAGTGSDPIRFIGEEPEPGSWGGIWIESDNDNELTYVEIAYGGGGDRSNLYLYGQGRVKITNSIFRDGSDWGINIGASGVTLPGFSSNEFRNNTLSAINIYPTQMSFIDGASTFTGNGQDVIQVRPGSITGGMHTWRKTTKPFLMTSHINIRTQVTINPGFQLLAGEGASRIRVHTDGMLRAVGTSPDPVRFIGEEPEPGSWGGIWIESDNDNELTYVEIAYGGRMDMNNLFVSGQGRVKITNSIFRDGSDWGMNIGASGVTLPEFSANEFRNNALSAVRIYPTQMSFMDGASTFTGNGQDVIEVRPGSITDGMHTWRKTSKPFLMTSHIDIRTQVTINPGFQLLAGEGASRIRVHTDGSIMAVGTILQKIKFTGQDPKAGAWSGLWIESTGNVLTFVDIAHGGAGGYHNILLGSGSSLSINYSSIRDSAAYGIYVSTTASLTQIENDFSNNAFGDVRYP